MHVCEENKNPIFLSSLSIWATHFDMESSTWVNVCVCYTVSVMYLCMDNYEQKKVSMTNI